ncbi:MAG: hypothetical protein AB3N20_02390 [Rhizobiaceae bacterium]
MSKSKRALALMLVAGGLAAAAPGIHLAHAECNAERATPTCSAKSKSDKCGADKE